MRRRLAAEAFATFTVVFAGTGAIVVDDLCGGRITHAGVSLTFGVAVSAMILLVGRVSGAHMNPAVSWALVAARRFSTRHAIAYTVAQLGGALVASTLLAACVTHPTLGATLPAQGVWTSVVLEALLTWLLMVSALWASTRSPERRFSSALVIGAVVALEAYFAGPIMGASMNPARSIAPALVSGNVADLWAYVAGPMLGALLAVPACRRVASPQCCPRRATACESAT